MNLNDFQIDIASLPDRENLVAEIYFKGFLWIEINQEQSDKMIIQFYTHPHQHYWEFPLEDALAALEKAKYKLAELGTTKHVNRVLQSSDRAYKTGDTEWKTTTIVDCKAKPHYVLWVRFDDGLEGEVDLSDHVGKGIYKAWESEDFWHSVHIDSLGGTVCWNNDIDLDPYVLREMILKSKGK